MNAITFKAVVRGEAGNFEWIDVPGVALDDGLVLHPTIRPLKGRHELFDDDYSISDIACGCELFSNDTQEKVLTDLAEYRNKLGARFLETIAEGRARCWMIYGHPPHEEAAA